LPNDGRDDARPRGNRVSPAKRQPERSLHSNVGNEPRLPGGADAQGVRSDHRPATPSTVPGELPRILAHESIGGPSPEGCLVRASCKAICRLFGQSAALPQPIRQVGHPRSVEGQAAFIRLSLDANRVQHFVLGAFNCRAAETGGSEGPDRGLLDAGSGLISCRSPNNAGPVPIGEHLGSEVGLRDSMGRAARLPTKESRGKVVGR